MSHFLNQLDELLKEREKLRPEGHYTTTLFNGGIDRILRKIGEESGEVIIAAKNHDKQELTNEAADLLFHLMVLLTQQGLTIQNIINELQRRQSPTA